MESPADDSAALEDRFRAVVAEHGSALQRLAWGYEADTSRRQIWCRRFCWGFGSEHVVAPVACLGISQQDQTSWRRRSESIMDFYADNSRNDFLFLGGVPVRIVQTCARTGGDVPRLPAASWLLSRGLSGGPHDPANLALSPVVASIGGACALVQGPSLRAGSRSDGRGQFRPCRTPSWRSPFGQRSRGWLST